MQPEHLELVGEFLAIRWKDGGESFIGLEALRRGCPCAHCAGEPDITGATKRPAAAPVYTSKSFEATSMNRVGNYAVEITWGDGHNTGIFGWEMLQALGEAGS